MKPTVLTMHVCPYDLGGAQGCRWAASSSSNAGSGMVPTCSLEHWQTVVSVAVVQLSAACMVVSGIREENVYLMMSGASLSVVAGIIWLAFEVISADTCLVFTVRV